MDPITTDATASASERPAPRKRVTTESIAAAFAAARAAMRDGKGRHRLRIVCRATDPDGTRIVKVPLTGGFVATVEAEDYDAFVRLGLSTRWLANADGKAGRVTVRFTLPPARPGQRSNNASVARVIAEAGGSERVRHRDGNPLNLRKANLYLTCGFAKGRELATVRSIEQGGEF